MDNDILEKIKQLKPELEQNFGITQIALFGSYSKGEAKEDSDIDIAIIEMQKKNGFLVAKAKRFISEKFHKEVDIGLLSAMNPYVRKIVEKEMIHV